MERIFTEPFTIGRGMQATLHVDSGRVSRIHVEVVFEDGGWVLRDAGSTNGTYFDGERIESVPLEGDMVVRLGREGPTLYLSVDPLDREASAGGTTTEAEVASPFLPGLGDADEDDDDTSPERQRGSFREERTGIGGSAAASSVPPES